MISEIPVFENHFTRRICFLYPIEIQILQIKFLYMRAVLHVNFWPLSNQGSDTIQTGQRIGVHSVPYFLIGLPNYHGILKKCLFAYSLIFLKQKIGCLVLVVH